MQEEDTVVPQKDKGNFASHKKGHGGDVSDQFLRRELLWTGLLHPYQSQHDVTSKKGHDGGKRFEVK
jgi:hypothetical protein